MHSVYYSHYACTPKVYLYTSHFLQIQIGYTLMRYCKLEEYSSHIPNEIIRIINKLEDNSNVYETACNCYRIINYVNNYVYKVYY